MKKAVFLLTLVALPVFAVFSQKMSTLKVDYSFKNLVEGYDHQTVTKIFVDDELVAESTQKPESKPNTVSCQIPRGEHTVRIVNYALYEGNWEEHTIENEYSIDAVYEFDQKFKKAKYKLTLVFDIDSGTTGKLK